MVQITSGVMGAVAATLAFGAVHLEVAAGNDLLGPRGLVSSQDSFQDASQNTSNPAAADPIASSVNRAAKSDRIGAPAGSDSVTLSFGLSGVPATSIMMRVPVKGVASPPQVNDSQAKNTTPRHGQMVACEPSVSVLTQVARQLHASRCVT
ncbi:MAG: hypothetical protein K2X60_11310 [Xanthobacteraceae bacterium]|nr:hypothetical protein [Xanthobacteraceae bacterium]